MTEASGIPLVSECDIFSHAQLKVIGLQNYKNNYENNITLTLALGKCHMIYAQRRYIYVQ